MHLWSLACCRLWVLGFAVVAVGGCAINIREPGEGAVVPAPVKVVVTGNASYSNLRITANGTDVTGQMVAQGASRDEGSLNLAPGTAIVEASADIYCWYCTGQTSRSTDRRRFTVVSGHGFIDIDAGDAHTCAVDRNNRAFCWGDNSAGQLGTGTAPDLQCSFTAGQAQRPCRPNPAEVAGGHAFRIVSAGDAHTCGLTTVGQVFCWGKNDRGQLGNGTLVDSRVPQLVNHTNPFKAVSAGGRHTCAIDDQGAMYCWGDNGSGQLGVLGQSGCPVGTSSGCSPTPIRQGTGIAGASFLFSEATAGAAHTCGSNPLWVKCWGDNTNGQLGTGQVGPATGGPNATISVAGQYVTAATSPDSNFGPGIAAGGFHSCALRAQGSGASCWGSNQSGELGGSWPATSYGDPKPVAVPGGVGQITAGISAGGLHSCALWQAPGATRVPVCAGYNGLGQLGTGQTGGSSSNAFARVAFSGAAQDFFKVTVGGRHSCALSVTGRLSTTAGGSDFFGAAYCWGDNTYGQVGQNYQGNWATPAEVHGP